MGSTCCVNSERAGDKPWVHEGGGGKERQAIGWKAAGGDEQGEELDFHAHCCRGGGGGQAKQGSDGSIEHKGYGFVSMVFVFWVYWCVWSPLTQHHHDGRLVMLPRLPYLQSYAPLTQAKKDQALIASPTPPD